MLIEFHYRLERGSGGEPIARPVAKAALVGPSGKEMVQYFYIDSGADFSIIPYRVGLYLGLDPKDQNVFEVQGINGAVGVIYTRIKLVIGDVSFDAKVGWAQLEHVPLLLGRTDVFDRFKVTFHQKMGLVIFEESS